MAKKDSIKVLVTLTGEAKDFVLAEQKRYLKQRLTRGKNKIINLSLIELKNKRDTPAS